MRNEAAQLSADEVPGGDKPGANTKIAAIILAAGRSQRMGAFKPLLPFGSRTVVESCIDNMRAGGIATIVVVHSDDARGQLLKQHLQDKGVTFAVNSDPDSEMAASIVCGLRAVGFNKKAVVINPVDHAAVPGEVVSLLVRTWHAGAKLVIPQANGRGGHPVLIDLAFRDELESLDPDGGLKAFFVRHEHEVVRLNVVSNFVARDMDTWDDYCALHREVFGIAPPPLGEVPGRAVDV